MLRPCAARHPDPAATARTCRLCDLWQSSPRHRTAWGGRAEDATAESVFGRPGGPATPRPPPPPPCALRGDPLTGAQRAARALDHRLLWRWCLHTAKPLGEAVCGCRGCGPRCPGYAAGEPDDD